MNSRNPQSRAARGRNVLIGIVAITLVALYGFNHRVELGQILDELRAVLPAASGDEAGPAVFRTPVGR